MNKIIYIIILSCICNLGYAQPNDKSALQSSQSELKKELASLEAEYKKISSSKEKSLASLRIIQDKIAVRKQMINNISGDIDIIEKKLTGTQKDIGTLNGKLNTLKIEYAKSLVYAYKNKNSYNFLTFVFSANSFNAAYRRIQYLREYRNYRQRQVEEIKKYKSILQGNRKILDDQKLEKGQIIEIQNLAMNELSGDQTNLDAEVKKFTGTQNNLAKAIEQARKRQQKITSQIIAINKREELERKKIREAEAKAKREAEAAAAKLAKDQAKATARNNPKTTTGTSKKTTETEPKTTPAKAPKVEVPEYTQAELNANASFESNKGRMNVPLQGGYIRTRFGIQDLGGVKWNNEGTTFACNAPGAAVFTIFSGTVKSVQIDDDTKTVYVSHGRYMSVYGNLSTVNVAVGETVSAGQTIGKCAASEEDASEGLLELMLFRDSKIENPERWLRK